MTTATDYAAKVTEIIDQQTSPDFAYPDTFDADVDACFQQRRTPGEAAAKLLAEYSPVTFAEFDQEISQVEGRLAYGSETPVYGHFVNRMYELGGGDWRDSDKPVPADEVAWWRRAYELYEADQQLPADEQADDVQQIFDRV